MKPSFYSLEEAAALGIAENVVSPCPKINSLEDKRDYLADLIINKGVRIFIKKASANFKFFYWKVTNVRISEDKRCIEVYLPDLCEWRELLSAPHIGTYGVLAWSPIHAGADFTDFSIEGLEVGAEYELKEKVEFRGGEFFEAGTKVKLVGFEYDLPAHNWNRKVRALAQFPDKSIRIFPSCACPKGVAAHVEFRKE